MPTRFSSVAALSLVVASACGDGTTAKSEGQVAYEANCMSCHGVGAAGGIGKNITFSTTAGIGDYTEADLLKSVRMGINKEGQQMCDTMTRFTAAQLSDAKVSAIYSYLKTTKNDKENKGTSCP